MCFVRGPRAGGGELSVSAETQARRSVIVSHCRKPRGITVSQPVPGLLRSVTNKTGGKDWNRCGLRTDSGCLSSTNLNVRGTPRGFLSLFRCWIRKGVNPGLRQPLNSHRVAPFFFFPPLFAVVTERRCVVHIHRAVKTKPCEVIVPMFRSAGAPAPARNSSRSLGTCCLQGS